MNKLKIIAKGGGIGNGSKTAIDESMIALSGKSEPIILLIATGKNDDEEYIAQARTHFECLGLDVKVLKLLKQEFSEKHTRGLIITADIIYVGGGNTKLMMEVWRDLGIDELLLEAALKGKVLAGVSAGAICWFSGGCSDSQIITGESDRLIEVRGLGLKNLFICPHFDSEPIRRQQICKMLKDGEIAVALDDDTALEIKGNDYRVISNKESAFVYTVINQKGACSVKKISSLGKINDI